MRDKSFAVERGGAVGIFCPQEYTRKAASVLGGELTFQASRWEAFVDEVAKQGPATVVVILPELRVRQVSRLRRFKARHSATALILVTRRDPVALRRLSGLVLDDIVPLSQLETRLPTALQATQDGGYSAQLSKLQEEVRRADHLPFLVRRALNIILAPGLPPRQVQTLRVAVGSPPPCLRRAFRTFMGSRSKVRLKDVLDMRLLVEARFRRERSANWEVVATELNVDRQTLWRLAERQMCVGLRGLRQLSGREVLARFREWVISVFELERSGSHAP